MSGDPGYAERRRNLLTGNWVLVSPDRVNRPWRGAQASAEPPTALRHDPACHLCPRSARSGGQRNPDYSGVYVFDNDFPALSPNLSGAESEDPLLVAAPESGVCRVVCYCPDHSLSMSRMDSDQIGAIVEVWAGEFLRFAASPDIGAVTIFENRGEMMGASSPHPHGQIWATHSVPGELAVEDACQRDAFAEDGEPLLTRYLRRELAAQVRIVLSNDAFVALVPFWAVWPFETLVLPRRAIADLAQLSPGERAALADLLARLTLAYDRLFAAPFPYTMGFHQRPTRQRDSPHFVLHAHFYPPLLRSASVRKFMVGFELLAMPQRDLSPEAAAERLRAVS